MLDDGNPKALYRRALAYEQQSEYDLAIGDLETAQQAIEQAAVATEPTQGVDGKTMPPSPPSMQAVAVAKLLTQLGQRRKKYTAKERRLWTKAFKS